MENDKSNKKSILDNSIYKSEVYAGGAIRIPLNNYNKASKCVCKITFKVNNMNGTGFFLYDSLNGNKFLITNYHVISRDIVNLNTSIEIEIFDGKKFDIELNKNAPNIKFFEEP